MIDFEMHEERLLSRPDEIEACELSLSSAFLSIKTLEADIASASDVAVMDIKINGKNQKERDMQARQAIANSDDVLGLQLRLKSAIENRDMLQSRADKLRREFSASLYLARVYAAECQLQVGQTAGIGMR